MHSGLITIIFSSINIINVLSFMPTEEDLRDCISCICHAKTACYDLKTCAEYSIDYPYFLEAHNLDDSPENMLQYQNCMSSENCIRTTILNFIKDTQRDCYCDERIDCRDMFSRHLYRNSCHPISDHRYERRFNNCAYRKGLDKINSLVNCVNFETAPFSDYTASYMWEIDNS